MTKRTLWLFALILVTVAGHGETFAAGFNCKHFSQTNHCNASWDSRTKACTCR